MRAVHVIIILLLCSSIAKAQFRASNTIINTDACIFANAGFSESKLGKSFVTAQQNEIVISTGIVQGRWRWTGKGFVTTGFKNMETGTEWVDQNPKHDADWDVRVFEEDVTLVSIKTTISTDEGFTNEHIRVCAEIEYGLSEKYYPGSSLRLRFEIWAYPEAPGFRTQLGIKGMGSWVAPGIACSNDYLVDYLPIFPSGLTRQTVGFYNNRDGRNGDQIDFVESRIFPQTCIGIEKHDEANILFLYNEKEGFGLVKESHKVVNKSGINTGIFTCGDQGIESTGWGLALANITKDTYSPCWASWRICWEGNEEDKQLALKTFDRLRYPVCKEEIVLVTNLWGGGHGKAAAKEDVIAKEIKSCANLGIDVVQIDAGWEQSGTKDNGWQISKYAYPNGFAPIMRLAEKNNIRLGIWNTGASVNNHDDKLNRLSDYGFRYYKIDIGSWNTYDMLNELTEHARDLLEHSEHRSIINWDVTHKGLRVGYLLNREYGNLFMQNRRLRMESNKNPNARYIPTRILKDQWMGASYLNLNQLMFNVQTIEFIPLEDSNARLYGDVYSPR